jgi:hypothetical protein
MPTLGPRVRVFLVTLIDMAVVVAGSAALVILLGGRTRLALGGTVVSLRGSANLFLAAGLGLVLRMALGFRLRPLPAVPVPGSARFDEERERLAHPAPATRDVWICAALTLAGSLIWIAPNLVHLRSVPDLGDPLFSAWRIARLVHQAVTDPRHLFDGNIFYPLPRTLTYSDSTFLEALAGSPFLLLGVDPLLVSNFLMLAAFPARALATFYAAWRVTGDPRAALVAGLIGAWYPFSAEHYSHLELQWTMFVPLAVVAGLRLLAAPQPRRGAVFGLAVAAQWLASMYMGVMLLSFLAPFLGIVALAWRVKPSRALVSAALAAAVVIAPALAVLGVPYMRSHAARGDRGISEISEGSARPTDYGATHERLASYQWHSRRGNHPEREMFPGTSTLALAGVGMVPPLTGASIATIVAGAAVFDWSLGLKGLTYDDLVTRSLVYRGMRVPARFSAVLGSALALLGAFGARRLIRLGGSLRAQAAVCAVLGCLVAADLRLDPKIHASAPSIPSIYDQMDPSMVVVNLPRFHDGFQDHLYMYFSTRRWPQLAGGYSGFMPLNPDLEYGLQHFPDADALASLRKTGATHVAYVCALERIRAHCPRIIAGLAASPALELVASATWEAAPTALYKFK